MSIMVIQIMIEKKNCDDDEIVADSDGIAMVLISTNKKRVMKTMMIISYCDNAGDNDEDICVDHII